MDRQSNCNGRASTQISDASQSQSMNWREYSSFLPSRDPFHSTPLCLSLNTSTSIHQPIPFQLGERPGEEQEHLSKLHLDFLEEGVIQYQLQASNLLKNSFSPIQKRTALKVTEGQDTDDVFADFSCQSTNDGNLHSQEHEESVSDFDYSNLSVFDAEALTAFPKTKTFSQLSRGKMLYTNLNILSKFRELTRCERKLEMLSKNPNQKGKRQKPSSSMEKFNFTAVCP